MANNFNKVTFTAIVNVVNVENIDVYKNVSLINSCQM